MMTGKRITNGLMVAVVAMGVLGLTAGVSQAQDIITPTSATANQNGYPDNDFAEIVNGVGLSGGGTSGDILSETHATATGGNWAAFQGSPFTGDTATFALPAASTVDRVHAWPFWLGTAYNWQITSFDIEFSTDGGGTFPTTISGITLDDIQATGPAGAIAVQTRAFTAQTGVTHIRFSNIGNNGGGFAGIMEVRFGGPGAAPATPGTLIYGK